MRYKKFFTLLALLLALALAAPGWATDVNDEDNLRKYVSQGTDVKLTKDIKLTTGPLMISEPVTIDGDGHKLYRELTSAVEGGSVISCDLTGTVTIKNLTITGGNTTDFGGGICAVKAKEVTITNCVFKDNTVNTTGLNTPTESSGGGAFFGGEVQAIEVAQCTFINNKAIRNDSGYDAKGGGMCLELGGTCTASIVNCTFTGNTAQSVAKWNAMGGGLYIFLSGSKVPSINFCTFVGNTVTEGAKGAEIYSYNSIDANPVTNSIVYGEVNDNVKLADTCLTKNSGLSSMPASSPAKAPAGTGTITHTVFYVADAMKVPASDKVTVDQLGTKRDNPTSIGAVEIAKPKAPAAPTFTYNLIVAPASLTTIIGRTASRNLSDKVKFEKVYKTAKRQTVDADLAFAQGNDWPSWLALDAKGTVTAKNPPKAGTVKVKFSVTASADGHTESRSGTLAVTVKKELEPPKIMTDELPDATVGEPYSAQLYATGDGSSTWSSLLDGELKMPGLKLDEDTGRISGTPKAGSGGNSYPFTVKASNSAGPDEKELSITVRETAPGEDEKDWTVTADLDRLPYGIMFKTRTYYVTFVQKKGQNVQYKSIMPVQILRGFGVEKFTPTNEPGAGMGKGVFTCNKMIGEYHYSLGVQARNGAGSSLCMKAVTASPEYVKLSSGNAALSGVAGASLAGDDEPEPDGIETGDGVTYFTNGSEDADGNISAVIGTKLAEGAEKEYVYDSLDELLKSGIELNRVVRLEFRKGAAVDVAALKDLPNLSELSIDECDVTELDLSGKTALTSLSLYGCKDLTSLDVTGCSSLSAVMIDECSKLTDVKGMEKCSGLGSLSLYGSGVTALDVSGFTSLANLDVTGCEKLTSLKAAKCAALENLRANGCSSLTTLDLGGCNGLKSLSLAKAAELAELTLPNGVTFGDFTLTGSKVPELNLSGCLSLDVLDLSGNVSLDVLNVSGNNALKELKVPNCASLISLNASGCPALEKLIAYECATLYEMNLEGSDALRELGLGGCAELRTLDVSGKALGYLDLDGLTWLTSADCSGQNINGVTLSQSMNLGDYAGPGLCRVSGVQGYGADGDPITAKYDPETGVATFAALPASVSYSYNTGLYDYALDVTLNGSAAAAPTSNRDSGGCDAGFAGLAGLMAVAALIPTLTRKRK